MEGHHITYTRGMSHAHGVLISLLVFSCTASFLFFFHDAEAVYIDADIQCPPGGKIDQPCKDVTNGYTTKGKCKHIYVCKADKVDTKTPPICAGGKSDCPIGGPPPTGFNPYPKPIKVASGSPAIPKSAISQFEAGVLDSVFSDSDEIDPSVDLEAVSEEANAHLHELFGGDDEEILTYVPESFDTKTSALFSHLRESAVTLSPGQLAKSGTGITGSISERLAYASGGFFGGPPIYGGGGSTQGEDASLGAVLANDLWSMPRFLAMAVAHAVKSIGLILLADFGAAGIEWAAARADVIAALSYAKDAFVALWRIFEHFLVIILQSLSDAL